MIRKNLSLSEFSRFYAISELAEAEAYLENETLRIRLAGAIRLMLSLENKDIVEILGLIDAEKFQSCLTLFLLATKSLADYEYEHQIITEALEKFFDGDKNFYVKEEISKQIRAKELKAKVKA